MTLTPRKITDISNHFIVVAHISKIFTLNTPLKL